MRKSALLTSLATLTGGLLIASTAFAGPCGGPGGGPGGGSGWGGKDGPGGRGKHFERAIDAAELDPTTAEEVRAIYAAARDTHAPFREQMREAHDGLNELLAADPPDTAAVVAQGDAIGALLAQGQKMRVATLLQVRNAVTADEWARLSEALEHKKGRKHRGGGAE